MKIACREARVIVIAGQAEQNDGFFVFSGNMQFDGQHQAGTPNFLDHRKVRKFFQAIFEVSACRANVVEQVIVLGAEVNWWRANRPATP